MANFAEMGKVELRAACKAAGISYGKLTVGGMKDALAAASKVELTKEAVKEMAKKMDLTKLDHTGIEGHCPHCGINHIDNGWCDYESMCDTNKQGAGKMVNEFTCLACMGEWGPVIKRQKQAADRHVGTGLKIEKVREKQNGVTRPSAGGKCRAVWDALDALQAELEAGERVTSAMVKDLAEDEGWNPNNASIEFYQWRKFHGISGRK